MTSAMSAVTGYPATTFNSAGLHPETARRFARENPGVQVFDTQKIVTSYQVSNEVLNAGLQHNIDQLGVTQRRQLAITLKEVADAFQTFPQADEFLQARLETPPAEGAKHGPFPQHTHRAIRGFLQQLAEKDTDAMLRDLPLATGQVRPLNEVKTWDENGRPVNRPDEMGLQELTRFAGPLLEVASATARGTHLGHRMGETAAATGQIAGAVMDTSGNTARAATAQGAALAGVVTGLAHDSVQDGVRLGGEALARTREFGGRAEAAVESLQGQAQARAAGIGAGVLRGVGDLAVLPDGVQHWAGGHAERLQHAGDSAQRQNQVEAAQTREDARQDAAGIRTATQQSVDGLERVQTISQRMEHGIVSGSGELIDAGLDRTAGAVKEVTGRAPIMGAGVGAGVAGGYTAAHQINAIDLYKTAQVAMNATAAGSEAEQRHSMSETVLPSMEVHIRSREHEIRKEFPSLFPVEPTRDQTAAPQPAPSRDAEQAAARPASPADSNHANHPMLAQIRAEIRAIDSGVGKPYDEASERISRCLLAACKDNRGMNPGREYSLAANELKQVDHVVLGSTGNIFAVEGKLNDPASKRAGVSVELAMRTPVEQSDQKLDAANQAISQERERDRTLTQQQTQTTGMRMS